MNVPVARSEALARLRAEIADVRPKEASTLPFGVEALDSRLADAGLYGASLHEIAPAAASLSDDAAAALFVAGIVARFAARTERRILWVVTRFDLYAPGLEQAGLLPGRLLFAEAREDGQVLAAMEDGLRHGMLAAVVGEVKRADMTATRRLHLAAADGKTPALLSRRWRRQGVCPLSDLSAAATRWRIGCAPSARLPAHGVGRARWTVELVRQRNGNPFALDLEACDETGRLALPAPSRDRATAASRAAARAA